jgi:hypothetical protein
MKKTVILLGLLLISMNTFSQISIKIKEFSIADNATDIIDEQTDVHLVMRNAGPRAKLKVEIRNEGDKPFRYNGGRDYCEFYATFNFTDTLFSRVYCEVKTTDIPYYGPNDYIFSPPSDMFYIDIAPKASYYASVYVYYVFSEDNYKEEFQYFIDSVILECDIYNRDTGRWQKCFAEPLKPGDYKIVDDVDDEIEYSKVAKPEPNTAPYYLRSR